MRYWFLAVLAMTAGCSSGPELPKSAGVFESCVRPDGSKQFSYRKGRVKNLTQREIAIRTNNDRAAARMVEKQVMTQGDRKPGTGPLYDELALVLEKNQFCSDGYFELDSQFEPCFARIIAECNDSATDAQRDRLQACGAEHSL